MRRVLRSFLLILAHAIIVRPVLAALGVRYRRRALVPPGPCLVVANHNSHLDAAVLMSLFQLRRIPRVHPVAAADYFGRTWFLQALAMFFMNAIPIERRAVAGSDPLATVKDALNAGESLIFFPEGSRGEAGVVAPFRAGVGRIVKAYPGLQVVPVFLSGPERIWPRGQMVPVPLSIDVNTGKPRSYDPGAAAAEIAVEVREDVLALAPPPPPVPGPRPLPPVRVAVCSIEPELRRQVFLEVLGRLGSLDRALGIATPLMVADAEGVRELAGGIAVVPGRGWGEMLARVLRIGGLYKGSKFFEMLERARIDEAFDHAVMGRFVVGDGNALVDLLAWAEAEVFAGDVPETELRRLVQYLTGRRRIPFKLWWRYARRAPEIWLLNVLDLVRLPLPSVLVVVGTSASDAMARIRATGRELARHENEPFLERLQASYVQVAKGLQRRGKVEVFEFAAGQWDLDEVAGRVEQCCRRLVAEPEPAAGP